MVQTIYAHNEYRTTCEHMDPRSNDADLDAIDPLLSGFNNMACISEVYYDKDTYDVPVRKTFISTERHTKTTAEALSECFGIGLHRARQTLKATRQQGTRSAILPLEQRYRADRRYERMRLKGRQRQRACNSFGFPIGIWNSRELNNGWCGIPENLTMDGAAIQVGRHTDFQKTIRQNEINFHISHPRRPNENDAEGYPIGKPHESGNPLLDSRRYDVKYADGETEVIAANILAENIYSVKSMRMVFVI